MSYNVCTNADLGLFGGMTLQAFFTWLVVYTISLQDKHIEEVRKNKESKDPADETEAD